MHSLLIALPDWLSRIATLLEVDAAELTRSLVRVAVIWALCYVALRLVRMVASRIERAVDDGDASTLTEREQRGQTISQLLRSVGRVSVVAVGLLLSLNVFIDIGPLLAGAGILGLAVSFGAQSLVKDVISGFFYLLEGQFAVGDVIEVSGKSGVVERMTLRMVVLRDLHGVVHMVPNGQITTVSNMTRTWSRAVVDVGVAYGTDVDQALRILAEESQRLAHDPEWQPRFDGEPEVVGVQGLDENQVTIRTLLRTHAGQQWAVGREFRRRIKARLDQEGIEIPYPQRTVHVRHHDTGRRPSDAESDADITRRPPPRPSQYRRTEGSGDT
ncbi:MAG: mechanosensitive ion channel family protein [Gemmatimonadota bacterium]|nr:mechanosensitive ion channel family protein [Gemmatimonadota bacterium]